MHFWIRTNCENLSLIGALREIWSITADQLNIENSIIDFWETNTKMLSNLTLISERFELEPRIKAHSNRIFKTKWVSRVSRPHLEALKNDTQIIYALCQYTYRFQYAKACVLPGLPALKCISMHLFLSMLGHSYTHKLQIKRVISPAQSLDSNAQMCLSRPTVPLCKSK